MDYAKINEAAMGYKDDMTKFLRDLVRIPGESCGEKGHIMRIKEEMEKVGFDKVQIDPMGNILGYMGTGKTLIGFEMCIRDRLHPVGSDSARSGYAEIHILFQKQPGNLLQFL